MYTFKMLIIADYYISGFQLLNKVWICPLLNHFNSVTYKAHNFSSYGSLWFRFPSILIL